MLAALCVGVVLTLQAQGAEDQEPQEAWMLADVHLDRSYLPNSDPTTNCQSGKGGECL